ncbi:MAG: MATE family efflux transporter [Elusimicrobiota bacterium]
MLVLPSRAEARSLLALAAPLILTQLGLVLYGTVDILFVGRLGPEAIAAVGLASISYFTVFILGMGIVMGIDSHSSKAFGAGRPDLCGQLLIHTLALALAVAVPLWALLAFAGPVYAVIGVERGVVTLAESYLSIMRWAMFPGLAFVACRQFLQSMNVTKPLLAAIVLGNLVNAALDWALIFGRCGLPALGVRGSACATLTANFVMLSIVAAASVLRLRAEGFRFHGWHRKLFEDVFYLGLPGGVQMLAEVGVFALVTALIGRLGAHALAANQITLNLISVTFMIPMGLSHAAAVRVGQNLGRGNPKGAIEAGRTALTLAVLFMAGMGLILAVMPRLVLGLFTSDETVLTLGTKLLYVASIFQIFDGAQAVLTGALRGSGNTRSALWANIVGHWAVGLPLGCYMAFGLGWGAPGLWGGLCAGLIAVCLRLRFDWSRRAAALSATG